MQRTHRRIIALSGTRAWCHATAILLIGQQLNGDVAWIGDEIPDDLDVTPFARRQQLLGNEYGIAVIDAWTGFDPDQFGAISGTVRGGGALLLLVPPLNEWLARPDPAQLRISVWPHTPATMPNRFIERVIHLLQHDASVEWLFEGQAVIAPLATPSSLSFDVLGYRSDDQRQAIAAIHHVMHGHRRRPLVLMADRGRGKSAALGIAAAELIEQGTRQIIVTAPHPNAVSSLFAHASSGKSTQAEQITFVPPDELLRRHYPCDLLLVDEAAAIPAPMLEQLLHRYPRIVFATTVHGYEGSGRGFALRFFKTLDAVTPDWKLLEMSEPIRWAVNDPLEQLTYQLLLLDASPATDDLMGEARLENVHYETISSAALTHNNALLSELFGLLVLSHYRTTPLDLRQLLDGPTLSIHVARFRNHIIGIALTLREGGFDNTLAQQIYSGERRPRGHLAPQSLAFHCGLQDAPPLVTERIMRIAVHPAVQQRGIGSALIRHIEATARNNCIDYLSTSFGATTELIHFWQRNTFLPVRIGFTREASSGAHSALMMRPLMPGAISLFARARRRFLAYLPLLLSEPLHDLDANLAGLLLSGESLEATPSLDEDDWQDIRSFSNGQRGYESCMGAIHKLVHLASQQGLLTADPIGMEQRQLLVAKVIQQRDWADMAVMLGGAGRKEIEDLLRTALQVLVMPMGMQR